MTVIPYRREAVPSGAASRPFWSRYIEQRRCARTDRERASFLVHRFQAAAMLAGLCEDTVSCAGIPGTAAAQVVSVVLGPTPRLMIKLRPGQLLRDWQEAAERLAAGMCVDRVRITARHRAYLRIELIEVDPIRQKVQLDAPLTSVFQQLVLGGVETGELLRVSLVDVAHIIVQGQTRSGKSRFTYGLLAQLAGCPDIRIAGSDVTGLLLRPFSETRHAQHQVLGSRDPAAHAAYLESLCEQMDERISRIPRRSDTLPLSEEDPLVLVIVEELPGLLRVATGVDNRDNNGKQGKPPKIKDRIMAAIGRLLAEGAKAGYRVMLISQRAEASVIDGFSRGQASLRISFRVDSPSSVEMLHPVVPKEVVDQHLSEAPGIALITAPELPVSRLRAPEMGDYGEFLDQVEALAEAEFSVHDGVSADVATP